MKSTANLRYFLLLMLLVSTCLVIPQVSVGQSELFIDALEVDIWPEYDQPGVLVIFHITLSADITLPIDMSLSIPTEAGDPNAVAVRDANGGLYSIIYKREVNGEYSNITFSPTIPEIQVEYYDPRLRIEESKRHYEFAWLGDYAINALTIEVQQPVGATELQIAPELGNGEIRDDGLTYYTSQAGSLPKGQTFEVIVDYKKETSSLSAESLEVKPSAPVSTITPVTRNFMTVLPWILGTLGVLLIFGGAIWWYWKSGIGRGKTKTPRRRRRLVIDQGKDMPKDHVYCHHCGKRATPGDKFCRTCGTRLRV